jgi:hypothetical protein
MDRYMPQKNSVLYEFTFLVWNVNSHYLYNLLRELDDAIVMTSLRLTEAYPCIFVQPHPLLLVV